MTVNSFRNEILPLTTHAGSKVNRLRISIPMLRSAKLIRASKTICRATNDAQSNGRNLRKRNKKANEISRQSPAQVASVRNEEGIASKMSRNGPVRANGLLQHPAQRGAVDPRLANEFGVSAVGISRCHYYPSSPVNPRRHFPCGF